MCAVFTVAVGLFAMERYFWGPKFLSSCQQDSLADGRICLTNLLQQWRGKIIWIDARSKRAHEYATVPVPQGCVFPVRNDDTAQELLADALPALLPAGDEGKCVVVFCDKDCASSEDVANQIKQFDLTAPIFVLEGGWDAIRRNPTPL